jgi:hypothetical protein
MPSTTNSLTGFDPEVNMSRSVMLAGLLACIVVVGVHPSQASTITYDFSTDATQAQIATVYPDWSFIPGAPSPDPSIVAVSGGQLRMAGTSLTQLQLLRTPVGAFTLDVELGAFPSTFGSFNIGIWVGENSIVFHPGYPGTALRVDGPNGFFNTDIGFTLAGSTMHRFRLVSDGLGLFTITLTDGLNPFNTFTKSFTNAGSVGGLLSITRAGNLGISGGGEVRADNFVLTDQSLSPPTNTPPTADAGENQTVRPGATVHLNGSGSFDDNTATNLLQYAWSFVSVPDGSTVATLAGANTMTPSFGPDISGDYVLQLVVTDQGALSSPPSQVTIGENPPPTANAGPDQLVIVGSVVGLSGSGADPDDDTLAYTWTLTEVPTGSAAQLFNPNSPNATFIPDRPGVYAAQLTVSDPFGPGVPDSVRITAITTAGYAEMVIQDASTQILGLPAGAVTNRGNQNAITQFLSNAIVALRDGSVAVARQQLGQAISRTDGCALRGTPDGNGPGRDWITTCGAQSAIYQSLLDALSVIPQ